MRIALAASVLFCIAGKTWGVSTIAPEHSFSWAANAGWINWRGESADGVEVSASYCAGYLYSGNIGWMNLGSRPVKGIHYSNSGGDFGVNIDGTGNLRGNAYGANIGWIAFESQGNPRIDPATGRFSGYAYSANIGWIALGDPTTFVQTIPAPGAVDLDEDGIADAWEIQYTGGLDRFTSTSDSDGDGVSDLQEFQSGTNPLDAVDYLRILNISAGPAPSSIVLTWSSIPARHYILESRDTLSAGSTWELFNTVPGTANSTQTSVTFETAPTAQFFRIRTEATP